MGPSLGWRGDAEGLVQHGLEYWYAKFQRTDGLFRTLINADGSVADDRAITYDQAFGLLAFSLGATLGDWRAGASASDRAVAMVIKLTSGPTGGFENGVPASLPLESNPHMHLFEATSRVPRCAGMQLWQPLADEIAEFALAHFLDGDGVLHEFFDSDWKFVPGIRAASSSPVTSSSGPGCCCAGRATNIRRRAPRRSA